MTIADTLQKGAVGLVSAALLSFGGLVLAERTEQAVQDTKITQLQEHQLEEDKTLRHLDDSVQELSKNTAVLADRVDHGKR